MTRRSANDYGGSGYGPEEYQGLNYPGLSYRNTEYRSTDYATGYQQGTKALDKYRTCLRETDRQAADALDSGANLSYAQDGGRSVCASYKEAMSATKWESDDERIHAAAEVTRSSFQPIYEQAAEALSDGEEFGLPGTLAVNLQKFMIALIDEAAGFAAAVQIMENALGEATNAVTSADNWLSSSEQAQMEKLGDPLTLNQRPRATEEDFRQ